MYTGFCDNRRVHRSFIKSWVTKKLFKVRSMIIILNATVYFKSSVNFSCVSKRSGLAHPLKCFLHFLRIYQLPQNWLFRPPPV
ncbi:hypothetical protein T12_13212 [Trichinella patagoniensis]|uniref:Uncharacterized protein n=1 Tax=Trichinella patagoniensis TaxID=990121 RepID=A0A0V1AE58_9BILA|nr:hypothetical protein T12_13212 [Trichinella patagoniensis]